MYFFVSSPLPKVKRTEEPGGEEENFVSYIQILFLLQSIFSTSDMGNNGAIEDWDGYTSYTDIRRYTSGRRRSLASKCAERRKTFITEFCDQV